MQRREYELSALVTESGVCCGSCDRGTCARVHAWRYRKRITDLSTGDVFDQLPILRVMFCDGKTASLLPAEVWRGRFTVSSVFETVVHVLRDGIEEAWEWTLYAGTGESMVSRRSLRRWRGSVHSRVIASALSWLGPSLNISWSSSEDIASQLTRLLEKLTGKILVAFRGIFGYAVLDKPQAPRLHTGSSPRRVAGRLLPAEPPNPPSSVQRRGTWSSHNRRGPPGKSSQED